MAKSNTLMIGRWAFLVGILITILTALVPALTSRMPMVLVVLFVLGLVVGFLNVSAKNSINFLIGLVALFVIGATSMSALSVWEPLRGYLVKILANFLVLVGTAGLVVSLKVIFETNQK